MKKKLLVLLFLPVFLMGQSHIDNSQKEVEVGAFLSTSGQNPFWLRSNQYGIVPLESQGITVRARIGTEQSLLNPSNRFTKKDSLDRSLNWKGFTFDYAVEAVANVGQTNQFLFPEAYAAVKWKAFELYAGRRREIVGLVDTTLTSGSYIWSGNALPMPKVQLSIPEYTPILGKGLVAIKGAYAHGWFGEQYYLKNVLLHQKWFYIRLGKPHWKVKFYGGFNHQVQWGGELNKEVITSLNTVVNNNIPKTFKDYINAVTGASLNSKNVQENIKIDQYSSYDLTNRIGNHLGTIDIAIDITLPNVNLFVYRQSFYDDGSLFYLANITDGLQGISIKRTTNSPATKFQIKQLTLEYLNSQNQAGSLGPNQAGNYLRGQDNYFNHGQIIDGWKYQGKSIGSAFIPPYQNTSSNLPRYANNGTSNDGTVFFFTNNNRVKYYYIGIEGTVDKTNFRTKISQSENRGTYIFPFPKPIQQTSVSFLLSTPWKKHNSVYFNINGVFDFGGLFKRGTGLYFGVGVDQ